MVPKRMITMAFIFAIVVVQLFRISELRAELPQISEYIPTTYLIFIPADDPQRTCLNLVHAPDPSNYASVAICWELDANGEFVFMVPTNQDFNNPSVFRYVQHDPADFGVLTEDDIAELFYFPEQVGTDEASSGGSFFARILSEFALIRSANAQDQTLSQRLLASRANLSRQAILRVVRELREGGHSTVITECPRKVWRCHPVKYLPDTKFTQEFYQAKFGGKPGKVTVTKFKQPYVGVAGVTFYKH